MCVCTCARVCASTRAPGAAADRLEDTLRNLQREIRAKKTIREQKGSGDSNDHSAKTCQPAQSSAKTLP